MVHVVVGKWSLHGHLFVKRHCDAVLAALPVFFKTRALKNIFKTSICLQTCASLEYHSYMDRTEVIQVFIFQG